METPSIQRLKHLRDHVALFLVWWATWTLSDTYLIEFTPTSEIVVLIIAIFMYCPELLKWLQTARKHQQILLVEQLNRM